MLLWPSFELHWNPTNGLFWDNFPCNIFGFHVCYISALVRRLNKCQWSPEVCINFLDYMGVSVSGGNFFQEKKRVPQKWLENKNILNLAAIATCHVSVIFLLAKFWVSHFCMPMSSRCMSPYWLFANHPEIGLSLSINLSHMKATKIPKQKRIKSSNPIISLDLITNYLNNTNNTHKPPPNQQTNKPWMRWMEVVHKTTQHQQNTTSSNLAAQQSDRVLDFCFFVLFIDLFTDVNMCIFLHIIFYVYNIHICVYVCIYIYIFV